MRDGQREGATLLMADHREEGGRGRSRDGSYWLSESEGGVKEQGRLPPIAGKGTYYESPLNPF